MDLGGAAGGVGRRDRDRRQPDRGPLPRLVRDLGGGGRGPRARAGAVRGRRQRLVRGPLSAVLLARGVGRAVGALRGADQGRRGSARRRDRPTAAHTGALRVGAVAVAGTAWQQSSFRAGTLTASLPTMAITEPLVASLLGVVVLGETLRPGRRRLADPGGRRGR